MPLIMINPAVFLSAADVDPFYSSNQVLMHFDGAFVDQMGHTVNSVGAGPSITNAAAKFGTHGADFGGYGGISTSIIPIGQRDYTVECWINIRTHAATGTAFFDTRNTSTNSADIFLGYQGGNIVGYPDLTQSSVTVGGYNPLTVGQWYHVAMSRKNGVVRVFLNGIQLGVGVANTSNLTSTRLSWGINGYIGGSDPRYNLNGFMDEARFTTGVGRYDTNFAVPNGPFPNKAA